MNKSNHPLFRLGDIHIMPGAQAALTANAVTPATLLDRHVTGDWSNLSPEDIKANRDAERAQRHTSRKFGHYLSDICQPSWRRGATP